MSQQAHSFIEYMMGDMEINTDVLDSQTQRVWDESSTIDLREAAVADFEVRNLSYMMVATNGPEDAEELLPPVDAVVMRSRASAMFTGGDGVPGQSGEEKLAGAPSMQLIKTAKEAVHELFELQRAEVQRSWGGMLDQEEALAYLICDALGLELLPAEARKIGNKAGILLKAAKAKDEKLRGGASAKRSKVRAAVAKEPARAAGLEERLAEIDSALVTSRAELWRSPEQLNLPEMLLVDARQRTAKPKSAAPTPLQMAEQELAAADDMKLQAELRCRLALRALAKVQPPSFGGEKLSSRSTSYFFSQTSHPDMPEKERQRRKELFDSIWAAERELDAAKFALKQATRSVLDAQFEVNWEKKELEHEQAALARARERAEEDTRREAEWARRGADLEEEDRAEEAAYQVKRAELVQQQAAERRAADEERLREMEELFQRLEARETRARLQAHAAHVWGGKENGSPKVFSLVGKSAEGVRAMSAAVSQEVTGAEERVALNRISCAL